jgi:hypothetical protein
MYPYGDGTDPRRFVLSLHKVLFETADGSLSTLQWANDKIVETHVMLDRWANQSLGGSSGMPTEYRAIKEFLRLGERNDTVVSCIEKSMSSAGDSRALTIGLICTMFTIRGQTVGAPQRR